MLCRALFGVIAVALGMAAAPAYGQGGADEAPADRNIEPGPAEPTRYDFILVHHPARLWTMKQYDVNYSSSYRIASRALVDGIGWPKAAFVQLGFSLFGIPLTHEEAHRSVLTTQGIGSISRPYPNKHLAAYVEGVTDATLIELRDTRLPTYIRLHTAGLESDYVLGNRCSALMAFELEDPRHVYVECLMRRVSHIGYFATSVFSFLEPDLEEEDNELERDIVGHDVYGAIRHLHRPAESFYRYTRHDDLTREEKDFVGRVALRSLLNFASPFLIGRQNFEVAEGLKLSAGLGYSMAPFGDFIDEQVWVLAGRDIRLNAYLRQYQNRNRWFLAGGASIHDFPLVSRVRVSAAVHLWRQPDDLDFNTSSGFTGVLGHLEAKIVAARFGTPQRPKFLSANIGITAKTRGFVPEETYLGRKVGLLLGATVAY